MSMQSGAEAHRGTLILVLGILSLVICALLGPFAWRMGKADLAKMDAGQMDPEGRGVTKGGMICGLIATILLCIWVVIFVLWLIFAVLFVGAAAVGA
jgi:hypothetical protein